MAWRIDVWPRTNEISSNSLLIVEGYGSSQDVIRELNKKHKIYLKSETSKISLQVVNIYEGQYRLTQAVLRPISKLIPGTTYTLQIDSLDQYEKEDFYRDNFKWTVIDKLDNEIPTWNGTPKYLDKQKFITAVVQLPL